MEVLISIIVYLYLGHIVVCFFERLTRDEISGEKLVLRVILMSAFPLVVLFGLLYYTRKFILNVGRKNDV